MKVLTQQELEDTVYELKDQVWRLKRGLPGVQIDTIGQAATIMADLGLDELAGTMRERQAHAADTVRDAAEVAAHDVAKVMVELASRSTRLLGGRQ